MDRVAKIGAGIGVVGGTSDFARTRRSERQSERDRFGGTPPKILPDNNPSLSIADPQTPPTDPPTSTDGGAAFFARYQRLLASGRKGEAFDALCASIHAARRQDAGSTAWAERSQLLVTLIGTGGVLSDANLARFVAACDTLRNNYYSEERIAALSAGFAGPQGYSLSMVERLENIGADIVAQKNKGGGIPPFDDVIDDVFKTSTTQDLNALSRSYYAAWYRLNDSEFFGGHLVPALARVPEERWEPLLAELSAWESTSVGMSSSWLIRTLGREMGLDRALEAVKRMDEELKHLSWGDPAQREDVISDVLRLDEDELASPSDVIRGVKFAAQYLRDESGYVILPYDVLHSAKDLDPKRLPDLLITAINNAQNDQITVAQYARSIDILHLNESGGPHTDTMRRKIISGMSDKALYQLASTSYLYTSTWHNGVTELLSRAKKGDVVALLESLGTPEQHVDLLDTLLRYRHDDALRLGAPLFVRTLGPWLDKFLYSDAPLHPKNVAALWNMVPSELRRTYEAALCKAVASKQNDKRARSNAAILLRVLADEKLVLTASAQKLAAILPEAAVPPPPIDLWTSGNQMKAHAVYYPDETAFENSIAFFKDKGFKIVSRGVWTELERTHAGVVQRLRFTKSEEAKRSDVADDGKNSYWAHRGHSFHLAQTFTDTPQTPMIIHGGSCGSYGDITARGGLASKWRGCFFIGDSDTGEGWVNDRVLLTVIDAIAERKRTWAEFGLDKYAKYGVVPPDSPAFLVASYEGWVDWDLVTKTGYSLD